MFYDTSPYLKPLKGIRDDRSHGLVMLRPTEGKRLIAKAVMELEEVKRVMDKGWFVVSRGVTMAYVLDELGIHVEKQNATAGIVAQGRLGSVVAENQLGPWVFKDGKLSETPPDVALNQFSHTDVSIKGANAVDMEGHVGVLAAHPAGGTVGGIWPVLTARGAHWISPVSMERLIPSVLEAAKYMGNYLHNYVMGGIAGLMPITGAKVVTEIQALERMTGVKVVHVASGGVAGSEGSVILALEGDDETVRTAFELCESVKGEADINEPVMQDYLRDVTIM
ncbi:MAG: hypothetical protein QGI84_00750 [Dehalococcoidia bacterium]|nr:hypothetical protein [Dehalococcoidia bacterium]